MAAASFRDPHRCIGNVLYTVITATALPLLQSTFSKAKRCACLWVGSYRKLHKMRFFLLHFLYTSTNNHTCIAHPPRRSILCYFLPLTCAFAIMHLLALRAFKQDSGGNQPTVPHRRKRGKQQLHRRSEGSILIKMGQF